jgi:hypothetical protein
VQRLSKQISLVLISSSLALHGCERPLSDDQRRQRELQAGGTAVQTGTGGRSYGGSHFYHSGPRFFPTSVSPGVSGAHSGATHSSVGGSARGGFGGSGHAAAS